MQEDIHIIRLTQERMVPIDPHNLEVRVDHMAAYLAEKEVVLIGKATHDTHEF